MALNAYRHINTKSIVGLVKPYKDPLYYVILIKGGARAMKSRLLHRHQIMLDRVDQ